MGLPIDGLKKKVGNEMQNKRAPLLHDGIAPGMLQEMSETIVELLL